MNLKRSVASGSPWEDSPPGPFALATVAGLLGYAVWSSVASPFDARWQHVLDELAFLPFRLSITILALELSRSRSIPRRAALGFRLFGYAFVISSLANLLRVVVSGGVVLPAEVRLTLAVPMAALMLTGLWFLARARDERGRAADWFDAGVIVLSGFLLVSHYFAAGNPFAPRHEGATRWLFLLYTLADFIALLFAATAWFRRPTGIARNALGLLTLGIAVFAAIDLRYDFEIQRGTWYNGGLIDVAVAIGLVLVILGLDLQRHHRPTQSPERPSMRQGRHTVAPIAIIAATLPLVQLAWTPESDRGEVAYLVTGVALLLILVLIRQHLARQQAARHLLARAAADARFRSLVQRSSDAIFQIAADHTIQWASPSAGEMTGTIPSLLVGRRISELAHAEDRDRLTVFLANAGEPFSRNAVLRWRLGRAETWHDVESVVSNLTSDEAVGGLVLNTRDVSERVRLEQQLRQSQKLEAVGRLAGGIAHDFNNILAAIITHAQLVRDMLPREDERAADLLEIEQTAQRGAVLTRRLLSFSRPEAGELRAQLLTTVVRGMEPMLRRLLVGQVELWLDLSDEELWVRTAEGQLEQILMNLAINARDAMPEGGVVHVRTRASIARPGGGTAGRGVMPGRWAELTVRDEGIGMDGDTLARLFEPFFTTKPSGLGTGLGLATVRGIVRALGGQVSAESLPGKGTTMRVLLPLAAAGTEVSVDAEAPAPTAAMVGRPVVLVVDDEVTLRRAMERYLTRHGYDAVGAGSALDALAMLEAREWAVDLVVTDMVMPRMGGREFVRRIRARAPTIPILCISGHVEWEDEDADVPDAPWAPDRLLAKPFPFPDFLLRVREALNNGSSAVEA